MVGTSTATTYLGRDLGIFPIVTDRTARRSGIALPDCWTRIACLEQRTTADSWEAGFPGCY